MTVRELHNATPGDQKILIVDIFGTVSEINRENPITLAAFGDFVIDHFTAAGENRIEIFLKLEPVKKA